MLTGGQQGLCHGCGRYELRAPFAAWVARQAGGGSARSAAFAESMRRYEVPAPSSARFDSEEGLFCCRLKGAQLLAVRSCTC